MTTTNKPSDQAPTNDAWDDLETIPTPPGKDHYQAQYLYKGGAAAFRAGVFTPFLNPIAGAIAAIGLLVLVGMMWTGHRQENLRNEAQAQKAVADMASFKKALAASSMTAACLATPKGNVPYQYFGECLAIAKAHAAAKEARK